jgi:cobyrinic acid a,c-diamide synthase
MSYLPRLVIAAPMSGSGKTTITAGLIGALLARGTRVAPFKVGPDYIDPGYHTLAAGHTCRNLDAWMLPPGLIPSLLSRYAYGANMALIEGVMGLFDGYSGWDDSGSTAHIARLTDSPILLVLDSRSMARTAAALVKGLCEFDPRVRIVGVLLNRVGSDKHTRMLQDAIETSVGVPVVGALRRDETLQLPERHLGLVPTAEPGRWQAWIAAVAQQVTDQVDLGKIIELASNAAALPRTSSRVSSVASLHEDGVPPVIAVARDAAFSFLYEENLDLLREAGADIAFFSPLHDQALPPRTSVLYLCGGFPELYAAELAANKPMLAAVRAAVRDGMPVYAECGGLMYLTQAIVDLDGKTHTMAAVLPGQSLMTKRLTLGYRTIQAAFDNWLWRAGETMRGHEFHYSTWNDSTGAVPAAYTIVPDEWRSESRSEGATIRNVVASYIHLHFLSYPELAVRFVRAGRRGL